MKPRKQLIQNMLINNLATFTHILEQLKGVKEYCGQSGNLMIMRIFALFVLNTIDVRLCTF
jgi:hypothetical protein